MSRVCVFLYSLGPYRAHFFQLEIRKKRDILSEKREGAKKREFTPDGGNVSTYGVLIIMFSVGRG